MAKTGHPTQAPNGGQGFGGGEQYEQLEGSFTDGGAEPGQDEDGERGFGAGKGLPDAAGEAAPEAPPEGKLSPPGPAEPARG